MITLEGNPVSTNGIYKRHGHIIYMSKEGKDTKTAYQWQAKAGWRKGVTKKDLEVIITLYFGDNRVHDIDNYGKILLDSLTGIVWEDDKQIQRMTVEKFIDKERPRIEIEVFEL